MKLHAKYGCYRPYTLEQEDILSFHYINICKTCDPEQGQFLPQGGANFNPGAMIWTVYVEVH